MNMSESFATILLYSISIVDAYLKIISSAKTRILFLLKASNPKKNKSKYFATVSLQSISIVDTYRKKISSANTRILFYLKPKKG